MKVKIRGKRKLQGIVEISGAKNSAVAILPACVLCDEDVVLRNVPNIEDVRTLIKILNEIGFLVTYEDHTVTVKKANKVNYFIQSEEVNKLRGSYYFMGAFLGKYKKVKMNFCGGCNLGHRPINFHLEGFKLLRAKVKQCDKQVCIKAGKLKGCEINLDFPSVGATINLMLAATKAKGKTTIKNAAIEPEIVDVGNFLTSMGADITGLGTEEITINGVKYLHSTDYTIISDRIEAGTYLLLGALAKGEGITVKNVNPEYLSTVTLLLEEIGCNLKYGDDYISIYPSNVLKTFDVVTKPYPGFPTDLGQLITVLMTQINGMSTLKETIFSNRYSHIEELKKMGANIEIINDIVHVSGTTPLKNAKINAYDLRGAASLVLAALLTKGYSYIDNIEVLLRGYEDPIGKLRALGLTIELID